MKRRVRIMVSTKGLWGPYDQGDVLDLDEPEAASLVRAGSAVYVERVERAVMSPLERGDGPAQRVQAGANRPQGGRI